MTSFDKGPRTALEAQAQAQWIAFAPFVFQAARILRDSGLLGHLEKSNPAGLTLEEATGRCGLSEYATRLLLEAGLGIGLLKLTDGRYATTKTAYFLLHDPVTRANLDFTQDVNYLGLFRLEEALKTGKPEGLKVFGDWPTLYQALAHFPPKVRESWLAFDHFYSDAAFAEALEHVFREPPRTLLDIGGNTGKFALRCLRHDPQVRVTILDLPGQLRMAERTLTEAGFAARVAYHEADLLNPASPIPRGFDAIWMSQFLDCFSEAQIVSILQRCRAALGDAGKIYILEPFWDRQRLDAAAFSLQMTSLYFAAMANGESRMYETGVFFKLVEQAGLKVATQFDRLGTGHTLLVCTAAG
jgi:ubiquinone/menaquinone biosynthesis C-methylase UbiE